MSAKPIPAKDVAASIMKIMDDVASEYPEEDREELKAVMLGSLGMALFNGPVDSAQWGASSVQRPEYVAEQKAKTKKLRLLMDQGKEEKHD